MNHVIKFWGCKPAWERLKLALSSSHFCFIFGIGAFYQARSLHIVVIIATIGSWLISSQFSHQKEKALPSWHSLKKKNLRGLCLTQLGHMTTSLIQGSRVLWPSWTSFILENKEDGRVHSEYRLWWEILCSKWGSMLFPKEMTVNHQTKQ